MDEIDGMAGNEDRGGIQVKNTLWESIQSSIVLKIVSSIDMIEAFIGTVVL